MYYINIIIDYIKNSYFILIAGNIELWRKYTYILFLTFLKVKPISETTSIFIWWHTIHIPYNFVSCLVLQEIFIDKLYKRLHGLDHVLDLWGFVWESALYLSSINKAVTVIESDPRNFELCKKNTKNINNITLHHAAVVREKIWDLYLLKNNDYRGELSDIYHENALKIHTISIAELEKQWFDGIKIDIEWWEYDLLDYRKETKIFTYKKWFIEFHFDTNKPERDDKTYEFIHFLQLLWYQIDFFTNNGTVISTTDFLHTLKNHTNKHQYINIFFEK